MQRYNYYCIFATYSLIFCPFVMSSKVYETNNDIGGRLLKHVFVDFMILSYKKL